MFEEIEGVLMNHLSMFNVKSPEDVTKIEERVRWVTLHVQLYRRSVHDVLQCVLANGDCCRYLLYLLLAWLYIVVCIHTVDTRT